MTRAEAQAIRRHIEYAAEKLEDAEALESVEMFPSYDKLVEETRTVKQGFRFRYDGILYNTAQPVYTFDGVYEPGMGTESVFEKVPEPGEGTQSRPIPYDGNMALENGKYYEQDGAVYLCFRDTVVAVFNPLSQLVGIYVSYT